MGDRPTPERLASLRAWFDGTSDDLPGPGWRSTWQDECEDLLAEVDALTAERDALRVERDEAREEVEHWHVWCGGQRSLLDAPIETLTPGAREVRERLTRLADDALRVELDGARAKPTVHVTVTGKEAQGLIRALGEDRDVLTTRVESLTRTIGFMLAAAGAADDTASMTEADAVRRAVGRLTERAEKAEADLSQLREAAEPHVRAEYATDAETRALKAALRGLPPDAWRSEVRAAALEEAARLCETYAAEGEPTHRDHHPQGEAAEELAARIRTLSTKDAVPEDCSYCEHIEYHDPIDHKGSCGHPDGDGGEVNPVFPPPPSCPIRRSTRDGNR